MQKVATTIALLRVERRVANGLPGTLFRLVPCGGVLILRVTDRLKRVADGLWRIGER